MLMEEAQMTADRTRLAQEWKGSSFLQLRPCRCTNTDQRGVPGCHKGAEWDGKPWHARAGVELRAGSGTI